MSWDPGRHTGWVLDEYGYLVLYVNGIPIKGYAPKDRTYD